VPRASLLYTQSPEGGEGFELPLKALAEGLKSLTKGLSHLPILTPRVHLCSRGREWGRGCQELSPRSDRGSLVVQTSMYTEAGLSRCLLG
jgi:hypothetical protein